jgi:hypothetical protein
MTHGDAIDIRLDVDCWMLTNAISDLTDLIERCTDIVEGFKTQEEWTRFHQSGKAPKYLLVRTLAEQLLKAVNVARKETA